MQNQDKIEHNLNLSNNLVLDTRFLSYMKLYILDILNAEIIDYSSNDFNSNNTKSIIKVNNTYCSRVLISGLIVGIYESEKYYRLKVDDSTSSINVTLWKSNMQMHNDFDQLLENKTGNSYYDDLYFILNNIKAKTIMFVPKQGDLVMINSNIKIFRGRIELQAVSCTRIQNSTEEIFNMSIPALLNKKIYSLTGPSQEEYEKILKENEKIITKKNNNELNKEIQNINNDQIFSDDKKKEEFLRLVYKSLIHISQNLIDQDNKITNSSTSCDSYNVFMHIRKNTSAMFQFVTYKQVLAALKELELTGLVYSCEDEHHFLPISI
jgi:hypothetical protein